MVLLSIFSSVDHNQAAEDYVRLVRHGAKVSWNMRGAWLLQEANQICDPQLDPNCTTERTKVLILLISLCATIIVVSCAFNFFREDKEESLTPLVPMLVVKESEQKFRFPTPPLLTQAASESANNFDVLDADGKCMCKISMDWPDPFRGSPHGVAATVRISVNDDTLTTIVARNVAVMGQGLALCRKGCEIFGFVEPAEGNKYYVRHRTGVHLLTLIAGSNPGNFDDWDIEGYNPVGSKVCALKQNGGECVGKVLQHVDAGLVLSSLMAIYVHRRLSQPFISGLTAGPRALSPPPPSQGSAGATSSTPNAVPELSAAVGVLRSPQPTSRTLEAPTDNCCLTTSSKPNAVPEKNEPLPVESLRGGGEVQPAEPVVSTAAPAVEEATCCATLSPAAAG